ncbi:hypothetical protein V1512DRAFT_257656 [Lipomyces arxii]|uniref:uncharacterized protein n=1 Tax=Lipomyces arxii TaxID=56418 RepID=UPI0034CEE720
MDQKVIQFFPFRSFVDLSFFQALSTKKLNDFKLDQSEKLVTGLYSIPVALSSGSNNLVSLNGDSFEFKISTVASNEYISNGVLLNFNTIDDFRNLDKGKLIQQQGQKLWNLIVNGEIELTPSKLSSFYLITFSDLKKFKFYYWFAFPAIHSDWNLDSEFLVSRVSEDEGLILAEIEKWSATVNPSQRGFFLLQKSDDGWKVGKLDQWNDFYGLDNGVVTVGFADPSSSPHHPGWPLRNFLTYLQHKAVRNVKVLCYRDLSYLNTEHRSLWLSLKFTGTDMNKPIRVTGWERISIGNSAAKLAPKMADLASLMDPRRLADQAVDLNLKLMRWRIAPDLDIDKVKNTRCLLLGAGTLGSYVARALMAWGVKKISFIDNATVSYSNPVRQSLYTFNDCFNGGKPKAKQAAESLSLIYPGVESEGYSLSVPMIGHPIANETSEKIAYDQLVDLIQNHDAVFLLMDSREARWLPTVIGCALDKIVINAALGFDSYVVMRHGSRESTTDRLGCYFCNDIYAPTDSLADQTLDQMCTVTRPGVALIASGLVSELLVSIVQHPSGRAAPATKDPDSADTETFTHPLGIVPHQIRGFLHRFEQIKVTGQNSPYCSACSDAIIDAWKFEGWEFVKKALNVRNYVDEKSGLAEVQRKADEITVDENWDFDDEESEEF